MSWEVGNQGSRDPGNKAITDEIAAIKGYIEEEEEAKLLLIKFFMANPSLFVEYLTGKELFPYQGIMLNTMMQTDYFLGIISRGGAKSWLSAIYIILDSIINEVQTGIISASFRQSKQIFKYILDIASKPEAKLLKDCLGKLRQSNDEWSLEIGNSVVMALPLGDGAKLRGFRFQRIVIDEGLLMPEKALTEVIMPFLSNVTNPTERANLAKLEDRLISEGKMKKEERHKWPNNKMMVLSSASYKFEYLYKGLYAKYEDMILGKEGDGELVRGDDETDAHRSIIQISYDMLPDQLHDSNLIAHSRATLSQAQFDREFGGQFTDDSDGYFKAKKMEDCTFEDGIGQSVEIRGEPKSEYLLSFDPSWSESETSDDFAMHVFKLEKGTPKGILVHSYALPGTKLSDHIFYFHYLLTHFNIVAICGDYNGGVQFMSAANESALFKKSNIEIKMIEAELDKPEEYLDKLKEARDQYNLEEKRICILRKPTSQWIRKANELLQGSFEHKRIMFASRAVDDAYLYQKSKSIPIDKIKFSNSMDFEDSYKDAKEGAMSKKVDFIENQWDMINLTKTECALITITTTPQGNQTFDLPQNLKRQTGSDRARKDSYSALVLGAWMIKTYHDIMAFEPEKKVFGFRPYVIH